MKNNSLHNIKKPGFKVPQDYFNSLDDTLLNVAKLKDEATETGFKTPDNYFSSLEASILNQVKETKEPTKVITIFNKKNILFASSIAAAVVLLFSITMVNTTNNNWNKLDIETVESYMLYEDVSSYEIASALSEEELSEENFVSPTFNEENIETYLLDHLEVEDLIE